MAVDYCEVNMQLETTVTQLPCQPTLFQRLGGQRFKQKWIICGGITNCVSDSSKVTAIINVGV